MVITTALVKELRERTGSGMMECKKALMESDGDIDVAIKAMRKSGLTKAERKSDRVASEGVIAIRMSDDNHHAAMVEVNCETDFVAKTDNFIEFAGRVAAIALTEQPDNRASLMALPMDGDSIEVVRQSLVAKIGENIQIRRFILMSVPEGVIGSYIHGDRIGTMVKLTGDNIVLARDIAMHVAASRPQAVSPDDLASDLLSRECDIITAQAKESGKPDNIIEKMVAGRMKKFVNEVTLLGQPFIKNTEITVDELIKQASAVVDSFAFFEVGEGIEKQVDNFAEQVLAQV